MPSMGAASRRAGGLTRTARAGKTAGARQGEACQALIDQPSRQGGLSPDCEAQQRGQYLFSSSSSLWYPSIFSRDLSTVSRAWRAASSAASAAFSASAASHFAWAFFSLSFFSLARASPSTSSLLVES